MEYMFNLLGVNQEVDDKPGANPLDVRGAELEFDAVDFGYNDDRQILHKLSFKVAAGKTTAIVGPSGSGKSTIGRLLFLLRCLEWVHQNRWRGYSRRDPRKRARQHRHRPAGHGSV